MARGRSLDGGVWGRRGGRWWCWLSRDAGADDDDDADSGFLDLAQLTAGRFRLALWSGAFLCRLLRGQTKLLLRHLRVGEEVGGRGPGSSVVARWWHSAAQWVVLVLASREKSEVLARTEMLKEVDSVAMSTVVCCWPQVLVFVLGGPPCCE